MAANMRSNPWYREPWPWILMSGPAIVVVAGIVTTLIAIRSNDGLVADDYYKQGLGINRVIERDVNAQALGVTASVRFNDERSRVQVVLAMRDALPSSVTMALVHPTKAGADQRVTLAASAPGVYEAAIAAPPAGLWHVKLEDGGGKWRVTGEWRSRETGITLKAGP